MVQLFAYITQRETPINVRNNTTIPLALYSECRKRTQSRVSTPSIDHLSWGKISMAPLHDCSSCFFGMYCSAFLFAFLMGIRIGRLLNPLRFSGNFMFLRCERTRGVRTLLHPCMNVELFLFQIYSPRHNL